MPMHTHRRYLPGRQDIHLSRFSGRKISSFHYPREIRPEECSCAASADHWSTVFRDGAALSQHLYAGHDFPCDHLRTDSDGRKSKEASLVRKRTISPCTVPCDHHGKLYSCGKSCCRKSDLASCRDHTGLWPGHAVPELGEKGGWAISVFPGS